MSAVYRLGKPGTFQKRRPPPTRRKEVFADQLDGTLSPVEKIAEEQNVSPCPAVKVVSIGDSRTIKFSRVSQPRLVPTLATVADKRKLDCLQLKHFGMVRDFVP